MLRVSGLAPVPPGTDMTSCVPMAPRDLWVPFRTWSAGMSRPARYGIAVAVALGAILVRIRWLEPLLGAGNVYIQSHPAILVAAWLGGLAGGLLATLVSAVGIAYAILPPASSLWVESFSDRVSLAVFVGIGALITVLVHAQQQSQRQAIEFEERYRSLVELSPDAVLVHVGGRIVYANPRTVRLLGASEAAQVLGRASFDFVAPPSQELARARTQQLLSGTKHVPPVEQEWMRLDGRSLPVEVTAGRVPWGDGEAIQVIFRDISDRRRADAERAALLRRSEAARGQAEKANRLKEEFLAVLSHELRTPLNVVLGWARMIQRGMTRADELTHALSVIERNATAQARMVEDLLDVSRIVTGQFQLTIQRMDLRQAAINAVESVRPAADAKGVELNVVVPSDDVYVLGDPVRVQQVIWNLLSNALKFTGSGGLVSLTMRERDREAELTVRDTGVGISSDFLPHVFDRFSQQDSSSTRPVPGLGLGLSLVRHLVEAQGGRVRASSAGVGSGATFVVWLPIADARHAAAADAADSPSSVGG